MTWTRLDDCWTDDPVINDLPLQDRWHYLALIQFCSRTKKYDGCLRAVDAYRCSDHPDARGAVQRMAALGLVTIAGANVKVLRIDEHIPPPSVRESSERAAVRVRRSRQHKAGDHSQCLPKYCPEASAAAPPVTPDVTRNTGSGQVRSGSGPLTKPNENKTEMQTSGKLALLADDPDAWPTEGDGLQWRNDLEERNLTTVQELMEALGWSEEQARNCFAAAYPGRQF